MLGRLANRTNTELLQLGSSKHYIPSTILPEVVVGVVGQLVGHITGGAEVIVGQVGHAEAGVVVIVGQIGQVGGGTEVMVGHVGQTIGSRVGQTGQVTGSGQTTGQLPPPDEQPRK